MGKLEQQSNFNPERKNEMPWWEVGFTNAEGTRFAVVRVQAILPSTAESNAMEQHPDLEMKAEVVRCLGKSKDQSA